MKLAFQRIHKSIQWLDQTELPDFAVITGPNGCGKTHLLEAILAGAVSIDSIDDPPRQIKYFSWNNLAPRGTGDVDPLLFFAKKSIRFEPLRRSARRRPKTLLASYRPEELLHLR